MEKIWSFFMNLGCNMWEDKWSPHEKPIQCEVQSRYYETLTTDRAVWRRVVDQLPGVGINAVVIDLGEGLRYESHPELAVPGSWTREELSAELAKMRAMGLEPIPKLNFSACHDAWLGEYAYMLSTKKYYEVVRDLIAEVCEVFENPRFFHLGMDEEDFPDHHTGMTSIRSDDLWWHDLYFYFNEVEKYGARPWIWSDYYNKHRDTWGKKMPKDCVQSPWQYDKIASKDAAGNYNQPGFRAYVDFSRMGYDQIPTATDWCFRQNFAQTVWLCLEEGLCDEHLLGFLSVPWQRTWEMNYYTIMNNAQRLKYAKAMYSDYHTIGRDALLARPVVPKLS